LFGDRIVHEELWASFFDAFPSNRYSLYLHSDKKYKLRTKIFQKTVLPKPRPTSWGFTDRALHYAWLVALEDPSNEMFLIVSGSCLPTKPPIRFIDLLVENTSSLCFFPPSHQYSMLQMKAAAQGILLSRRHVHAVTQTLHDTNAEAINFYAGQNEYQHSVKNSSCAFLFIGEGEPLPADFMENPIMSEIGCRGTGDECMVPSILAAQGLIHEVQDRCITLLWFLNSQTLIMPDKENNPSCLPSFWNKKFDPESIYARTGPTPYHCPLPQQCQQEFLKQVSLLNSGEKQTYKAGENARTWTDISMAGLQQLVLNSSFFLARKFTEHTKLDGNVGLFATTLSKLLEIP
jgi:hypothetical protein